MPKQIFTKDTFLSLLEKAQECRVVRRGDKVKLKLRTQRYLYTYITNAKEADELLEKVKVKKVEF
ncbi:MAG: hypothetical protein QXX95_02730 [Nitrososphaerales archaeon]